MLLPDWFLVRGLGTLVFPDERVWKFDGAVSGYMAHMWTMPVTWVLWSCPGTSSRTNERRTPTAGELLRAATVALLIFGAAEHLSHPLGLWQPTPAVRNRWGHAAVYVLPAEAALGAAALLGHRCTAGRGWLEKAAAAAVVATLFTGALAIGYTAVERRG